jgi:hypothetical protein
VGTQFVGEDKDEGIQAATLVSVTLFGLRPEGRRRQLWRADDASDPSRVSWRGEWVEVRIPEARVGLEAGARLVVAEGEAAWEGRFEPGAVPSPRD